MPWTPIQVCAGPVALQRGRANLNLLILGSIVSFSNQFLQEIKIKGKPHIEFSEIGSFAPC